jgi:DNA-binding CsgD family transcriptional regulator
MENSEAMQYSNCIIIHSWPIVQLGLRSVLQSLKVEVREVFSECPECKIVTEWSDVLMLIDVKHEEFVIKHRKLLGKRNISVIGLNFDSRQTFDASIFADVVYQEDIQNVIFFKLNKFSSQGNKNYSTYQLSSREIDVLKQVALGLSNKQISENLYISIHTVITHRKHITSKLGIKSISGLTLYAVINNLID